MMQAVTGDTLETVMVPTELEAPLVSIVISNFNGHDHLHECLGALGRLDYPRFEVIVVDAASTDDSVAIVERDFPWVRLIRLGKVGIGEAVNVGLRLARGELAVFDLNNDDVVDRNWLWPQVQMLLGSRDVGVVCGKRFCYRSNRVLDSAGGLINYITGDTPVLGQNRADSDEFRVARDVDYVGVILTRRDILRRVGLVDEGYFIYHEDADFCLRVKRAGYRVVYVPEARLWHKGSSTVGKASFRGYYYMSRNEIRFVIKNFPFQYALSALAYFVVFRTLLDVALMVGPVRRVLVRLMPRFKIYLEGKSDRRLLYARRDAIIWNAKNLRKTLQARYQVQQVMKANLMPTNSRQIRNAGV
jgi:GT2 family glycosyltransferase